MKTNPDETNRKFWLTAAIGGALILTTSGAQSTRAQTNTFPSTGNVGIGTTSPGALLEVNKSQNAGTTVVVDNGYTTASNAPDSGALFKQAGANRFLFGSINDGNTVVAGGAGGIQLWNFV